MPKGSQGFREALAADGFVTAATIGRSAANRGFSVVAVSKDGQSYAAKGTDESAGTGVLAAKLRAEYGVLRSLSHVGIAQAQAFVEMAGGCAMVMERCPGLCLEKLMPQGSALCCRRRHGVLQQILDAVSYLHGQQVAHMDLHCQNVLIDAPQMTGCEAPVTAKIIDFGSARQGVAKDDGGLTELEEATQEILPPAGAASRISLTACDVFAVGLLTAGLVAGRPCFTADLLSSAEPRAPRGFLTLSAGGERHLASMLAPDPVAAPSAALCVETLPPLAGWLA